MNPFGMFKKNDLLKLLKDEQVKSFIKAMALENTIALEEKVNKLKNVNKQLVESISDLLQNASDEAEQTDEALRDAAQVINERRRSDLKIINENFRSVFKQMKDMDAKFEGVLEILAEHKIEQDAIPVDLLGSDTTLKKIFVAKKNKNEAALYGLFYMMKRFFEDKGFKI